MSKGVQCVLGVVRPERCAVRGASAIIFQFHTLIIVDSARPEIVVSNGASLWPYLPSKTPRRLLPSHSGVNSILKMFNFCVDSLLYWRFRCPDFCRLSRKYVQNASRFTLQQSRDFWVLLPCFFPSIFHSVGGECLGVLNALWPFVLDPSSSSLIRLPHFSFLTEKKSHWPGCFLFLWTPDSTLM